MGYKLELSMCSVKGLFVLYEVPDLSPLASQTASELLYDFNKIFKCFIQKCGLVSHPNAKEKAFD